MKGIDPVDEQTAIFTGNDRDFEAALGAGALDAFEVLDIQSRSLTRIPAAIARLTRLRELPIEAAKLTSIDDAIFECAALERLELSTPKLARLPEGGWKKLTALKTLSLPLVKALAALPADLGDASALEGELDLRGLKVDALPESIGHLARLGELSVSGQLKRLPDSMGGMRALHRLTLTHTKLTRLPDDLGQLGALRELWANSANLGSVPESIGDCAALTILDLSSNRISSVPESITRLSKLRELSLNDNPITHIPDGLSALPLRIVRLGETRVTALPADFARFTSTKVVLSYAQQAAVQQNSPAVVAALGENLMYG